MATVVLATVLVLGAEITTTALVVAAVAALAVDYTMMQQEGPDGPTTIDMGSSIDKSSLQQEAKVGDLELGEEAKKKKARAKGKEAFKVKLEDQGGAADDTKVESGVQAPEQKQTGVQL